MSDHGTVIANYEYDAYGKLLSITNSTGAEITFETSIALLNPFRYRGYVYDDDTGLYYLRSRYYDPEIGRFINADDTAYISVTGNANLYSYCENDSINYIDDDGNARKKYSISSYKNKNWITKLVSKFIPNLYSGDMDLKVLFNKSFLGVGLKISVGAAVQSNASGLIGILVSSKAREISVNLGFGTYTSFSCALGLTRSSFYIKFAVLVSPKNSGIFFGVSIQISVSYLTALAIAACCVAQPYLSSFMSSALSVVSASMSTVAKVLVPMSSKFIYLFI